MYEYKARLFSGGWGGQRGLALWFRPWQSQDIRTFITQPGWGGSWKSRVLGLTVPLWFPELFLYCCQALLVPAPFLEPAGQGHIPAPALWLESETGPTEQGKCPTASNSSTPSVTGPYYQVLAEL